MPAQETSRLTFDPSIRHCIAEGWDYWASQIRTVDMQGKHVMLGNDLAMFAGLDDCPVAEEGEVQEMSDFALAALLAEMWELQGCSKLKALARLSSITLAA